VICPGLTSKLNDASLIETIPALVCDDAKNMDTPTKAAAAAVRLNPAVPTMMALHFSNFGNLDRTDIKYHA
jgi:hypothetical protein